MRTTTYTVRTKQRINTLSSLKQKHKVKEQKNQAESHEKLFTKNKKMNK